MGRFSGQGGSEDTLVGGDGANTIFGAVSEIDEAFVLNAAIATELQCMP